MAAANTIKRTVIVTGASSGLGLATAKKLCKDGYDVIFACRNMNKAQDAMDTVVQEIPDAKATLMKVDLANMSSIPEFVASFKQLEKPLFALVNNAGVTQRFEDKNRIVTSDGFELTMATNYIGHFLLTNLLLDDLKNGAKIFGESRVVSVTSSLHDPDNLKRFSKKLTITELDLENFNLEKENTYSGIQAYKNSKAAQIMFTYELARRLEGTGVTTSSVCPGFVPSTDLGRENPWFIGLAVKYVVPAISYISGKNFTTSLDDGSSRIYKLATDPELKGQTALFYKDNTESESKGNTRDVDLQKKLWDHTAQLVRLT